jgi:Excalibur calcium-binding domain
MTKILSKVYFVVSAIAMLIPFSIAMITSNVNTNIASAAPVYACPTGETLSGMDCVINVNTSPTFATQCTLPLVEMQDICVQRTPRACTDFFKMVVAETGWCKVDPTLVAIPSTTDVVASDFDGRYCSPKVTLPTTPPTTIIYNVKNYKLVSGTAVKVCGNAPSTLDNKAAFRIAPFTIDMIKDYSINQIGSTNSVCPTGYTAFNNNTQCKRSAVAKACDVAGEYFATSGCTPCMAGQYCPMPNANNTSTVTICPNGGLLTADKTKCTAQNKISTTTYTDGCPAEYLNMGQSCAIKEDRAVDKTCTYFLASSTTIIKAAPAVPATNLGYDVCSFVNIANPSATYTPTAAEIFRAQTDLRCLGTGYWYNYNIGLDPLVCGFGDIGTGFTWTAFTFSKITPLQKIPAQSSACPNGWIELDATTCYQPPITVDYKGPIVCPVNTYSMAGASTCVICPNGATSPAGSMSLAACVLPPVTSTTTLSVNTINPPSPSPKVPCVSPMGSYTNASGDCVPCPAGTMSMNPGSKSIDDCIKIMTCADFLARGMGNFKIGDPNYSRERDADGDGVACELPKVSTIVTVRTGANNISIAMISIAVISGLIGLALVKKENQLLANWSKSK